jgi:hypothetical protein
MCSFALDFYVEFSDFCGDGKLDFSQFLRMVFTDFVGGILKG